MKYVWSFFGEEGKTQFELVKNNVVPQTAESVSFGFTLDNLDEVLEACKDSAVLTPNQKFWMVKDPDGYNIQLKNTK